MELPRTKFWNKAAFLPLGDRLNLDPKSLGNGTVRAEVSTCDVYKHAERVSMLSRGVKRRLKLALSASGYPTDVGTLGERMKALRLSRSLTLEEMAKVMEITPQALSQIESGKTKNVRLDNFLRFCAYFDADPYFVVFGDRKASATGRFRKIQLPET